MKKVIVTGATGFIGGALTKKLLLDGVKVYGVDIDPEKLDRLKEYGDFVPVVADFAKYDRLYEMIDDDNFDVFFHFAWCGVFGKAFQDYSLQLSNVKYACDSAFQAIALKCKKIVFSGTMNEYEASNYFNCSYCEPRYTCVYGTSKLAAELILKTIAFNNGIEYCGGLISMAYGENNYSKMLPNVLINQFLHGVSPKLIKGDTQYDMIYIDDIVNAFIAIGERGTNLKSYYVGHRKIITFKELITQIGEIIAPNIELRFGEYPESTVFDYSIIDVDSLYKDTGFECQADFKDSILKTADWVKSLNWEV